jgi:tripartite-type tricarboxylate transporter receptor subunit TctC
VHPSLPVSSVGDLIGLARAKPGTVNYASGGTGGAGHLMAELFKSMAGVNIVHVPYKGGSAAITDLLSGQVQMTFDNPSTMMPLVKAGKLKALAVTSLEPTDLLPGMPTVSATLPGFEAVQLSGIYAPANTPVVIVRRLNLAISSVLGRPDMKEKFSSRAMEVMHSSPEAFGATVRSEISKWAQVIKDANIKAD